VPVEDDTYILTETAITVDGYDALHQTWRWDGIDAASLIFLTADVAGLSEEDLKRLLYATGLANEAPSITISQTDEGYTFVNFNFSFDERQ
jgi:hypothetical protein